MVKLHITPQELQTLQQTDIFYVKRQFFDKLSQAFAGWQTEARQQPGWQQVQLPVAIDRGSGKISRGENYEGLPWMMADMPRHFGQEDVLAFRMFFWWGHYFSATWHLKGAPLNTWWPRLREWLRDDETVWVSWEGDEWNHTIQPPTYVVAKTASCMRQESPPEWLKISVKMALDEDWYDAGTKHFTSLLQVVC